MLGHLGYRNEDIGTLARLLAAGRLDLSRSVSGIVPLERLEPAPAAEAGHARRAVTIHIADG